MNEIDKRHRRVVQEAVSARAAMLLCPPITTRMMYLSNVKRRIKQVTRVGRGYLNWVNSLNNPARRKTQPEPGEPPWRMLSPDEIITTAYETRLLTKAAMVRAMQALRDKSEQQPY